MPKYIQHQTSKYDLELEVSKVVQLRDYVIDINKKNLLDPSTPNSFIIPDPREDTYSHYMDSQESHGIRNMSNQEATWRFSRWCIEKSLLHKGAMRKKYQDLCKSMDGRFSYLGSAPYIDPTMISKLPDGWDEFAKEEETSPVFESRLIAAQACLPDATSIIDSKTKAGDDPAKYLSQIKNGTTKTLSNIAYMNLTGLNVDPSDEGSNKSNTDTESIRNKLRKRVEELQKERKDKNASNDVEASNNSNISDLQIEENDDQYHPELKYSTSSIFKMTQTPLSNKQKLIPTYTDQSPNIPSTNEHRLNEPENCASNEPTLKRPMSSNNFDVYKRQLRADTFQNSRASKSIVHPSLPPPPLPPSAPPPPPPSYHPSYPTTKSLSRQKNAPKLLHNLPDTISYMLMNGNSNEQQITPTNFIPNINHQTLPLNDQYYPNSQYSNRGPAHPSNTWPGYSNSNNYSQGTHDPSTSNQYDSNLNNLNNLNNFDLNLPHIPPDARSSNPYGTPEYGDDVGYHY